MVSAAVPPNFAPSFRRLVAAPVLRSYAVISKSAPRKGNANEWRDRNYLDPHSPWWYCAAKGMQIHGGGAHSCRRPCRLAGVFALADLSA